MKISKRQSKILKAIIREYIATAKAVSSARLVRKYSSFKISSATMRNEMVVLEEAGLIEHLHTSAGRTPTDKGYRYFVDNLMRERSLSKAEQKKLTLELLKTKTAHNKLLRRTTQLLSELTGGVALASMLDEGIFFDSGLRQLLEEPEFAEKEPVYEMAQIMDSIDEHVKDLIEKNRNLEVYIGEENPLCDAQECATIVSRFRLPSGEKGIIALIGPKRMRYARNMSLLDYLAKFLSGSLGAFLFLGAPDILSNYF